MHSRGAWLSSIGLIVPTVLALAISPVLFSHHPASTNAQGTHQVFIPMAMRECEPAPTGGTFSLPPNTSVALGRSSRLGVWLGDGDSQTVGLLKTTGAKWTRLVVSWSTIEPTYAEPPSYDFGMYDQLFSAIAAAGMQPIVEIRGNPSWAAATSCGPINRLDRFDAFVRAIVAHYMVPTYNVKHWEFYNEPENTSTTWGSFLGGCFGNTPDKYVEMLRVAYNAVKQTDGEAKVVLGGLALGQHTDPNEGPIFNTAFLTQTLALNGGAYFDIANIHYFSSQNSQWSQYGLDIAGKANAIRQFMANYGVTKPVVATELSWTSTPADSPDTPEQQARYVPKVLARGLANDLYAMTWFLLSEWNGADYPYGLLDIHEEPRPAYYAFRVAACEFGSARAVRPLSAGEVGVAGGVEGYVFDVSGQERWVLWSSADGTAVPVSLPRGIIRAADKLGRIIPLGNGPAQITLDGSPIYLRMQR